MMRRREGREAEEREGEEEKGLWRSWRKRWMRLKKLFITNTLQQDAALGHRRKGHVSYIPRTHFFLIHCSLSSNSFGC